MEKKVAILFALSLVGCMRVTKAPDTEEDYYYPTNIREWTLKKNLEALGYEDVNFQIPMNKDLNYSQTYYLNMTPKFCITTTNFDSVVRFRDSLCKELYVEVIEDSVLVDLKKVFISFKTNKLGKCKKRKYASEEYEIEALAERYNFRVVRNGNSGYQRVPVK